MNLNVVKASRQSQVNKRFSLKIYWLLVVKSESPYLLFQIFSFYSTLEFDLWRETTDNSGQFKIGILSARWRVRQPRHARQRHSWSQQEPRHARQRYRWSQQKPRHARQRYSWWASGRSAARIPRGRRARSSEPEGSAAVDKFSPCDVINAGPL